MVTVVIVMCILPQFKGEKKNGQGRPPKGEACERPLNEEGALGPMKEKLLEIPGTSAGAARMFRKQQGGSEEKGGPVSAGRQ